MARNPFPHNSGLGPRARKPRTPQGAQIGIHQAQYQISFDQRAFKQFIQGQGVKVVHYRALPDPTGMNSRGDTHAVSGLRASSDGFLYEVAGEATVLFTNNSGEMHMESEGMIQYATAYMTLPEKYDDTNEPLLVFPNDRLFIKDVELRVVNAQYIESNTNGTDRLQFPATYVESLVDSDKIKYEAGTDFELTKDGDIRWLTQRRPGINPSTNRGKVYTIRYRYTPFFIVARLLHEIRVAQITDPQYKRYVERMPYQVMVVREYIFQDKNQDPNKQVIDHRFTSAPDVGGALGPK